MTKQYDVVIDPGHEGLKSPLDPGAVSKWGKEAEYTLKISLYQYERFKELGVNVGLTRTGEEDLTQSQRTLRAKQGKVCYSNHLNAGGGDRAEVIHSIYDDGKLANVIKQQLLAAGQNAVKVYCREYKGGDYYYMHRETGTTQTIINEYCFIDNEADFKHFKDNWQAYAEATVKAHCQHFGINYIPPKTQERKEISKVSQEFLNSTGRAIAKEMIKRGVDEKLFMSKHENVENYEDKELISYALAYVNQKLK